jgi:hypothetical protein
MPTVSEFIASPAMEETIVTNCPKYRGKFSTIIEKAGVQESDTKDARAIKKISSTTSWNWAAFLFSYFWLIYRKENLKGWGLLIGIWFLAILSSVFFLDSALDSISSILPIIVMVLVGIYGNSYILINAMKAHENTIPSGDRNQRSPKALFLAIFVALAGVGIVWYVSYSNIMAQIG